MRVMEIESENCLDVMFTSQLTSAELLITFKALPQPMTFTSHISSDNKKKKKRNIARWFTNEA
jgi:hypothetical protein